MMLMLVLLLCKYATRTKLNFNLLVVVVIVVAAIYIASTISVYITNVHRNPMVGHCNSLFKLFFFFWTFFNSKEQNISYVFMYCIFGSFSSSEKRRFCVHRHTQKLERSDKKDRIEFNNWIKIHLIWNCIFCWVSSPQAKLESDTQPILGSFQLIFNRIKWNTETNIELLLLWPPYQ